MILKNLNQDDAKILFELFHQSENVHYLDLPVQSLERFTKFINEILAGQLLGFCRAMTIWSQDQIAGFILLNHISVEEGIAEMGTWLGAQFRGRGLNQEAKQEMLAIAFGELSLHTVLLLTARENIRSQRALAKLPYVRLNNEKYAKRKKQQDFLFRTSFDIYEVKKEDYFAQTRMNHHKI